MYKRTWIQMGKNEGKWSWQKIRWLFKIRKRKSVQHSHYIDKKNSLGSAFENPTGKSTSAKMNSTNPKEAEYYRFSLARKNFVSIHWKKSYSNRNRNLRNHCGNRALLSSLSVYRIVGQIAFIFGAEAPQIHQFPTPRSHLDNEPTTTLHPIVEQSTT